MDPAKFQQKNLLTASPGSFFLSTIGYHRPYKVGPPFTIAKLVHITPMSLWFKVPITIVFMGFINHLITGGPHLAWNDAKSFSNEHGVFVFFFPWKDLIFSGEDWLRTRKGDLSTKHGHFCKVAIAEPLSLGKTGFVSNFQASNSMSFRQFLPFHNRIS